jgi:hypothetical protein
MAATFKTPDAYCLDRILDLDLRLSPEKSNQRGAPGVNNEVVDENPKMPIPTRNSNGGQSAVSKALSRDLFE